MELLYVWIEDYKNIKKQGFNFSPKHRFDFKYEEDETGKVTGGTLKHEKRNSDYPKNFFGENISNVTAIIGKNGSGKTNIFNQISQIIGGTYSKFAFSVWSKSNRTQTIFYTTKKINSDFKIELILNIYMKK